MKRKLIALIIVTCLSSSVFSQIDNHFSMFSETKVQINPAAAGYFNAKYKFFANYRNQWRAASVPPFKSYSATFDSRIYEDQTEGIFLGTGLIFNNDVTGDSKYNQLQITVPISYSIRVGKYNYLSFGVSPGYFQRSINNSDLTWQRQWDNTEFNPDFATGELLLNDRYTVGKFDIGAGLYFELSLSEYNTMHFGVSGGHLTRPKINFLENDERMRRSLSFHYFGSFGQDNSPITAKPNVIWQIQGPNQYLILGSSVDILLKGNSIYTSYSSRKSLELGVNLRMNDAVIASMAFHNGSISMGYSYDFTVSSLTNITKVQGGSEFFVYYRIGSAKSRGKLELVDPD